jgi:hypothetical protein
MALGVDITWRPKWSKMLGGAVFKKGKSAVFGETCGNKPEMD